MSESEEESVVGGARIGERHQAVIPDLISKPKAVRTSGRSRGRVKVASSSSNAAEPLCSRACIPDLHFEASGRAVGSDDNLVWCPSIVSGGEGDSGPVSATITDYLLFVRNLLEQTEDLDGSRMYMNTSIPFSWRLPINPDPNAVSTTTSISMKETAAGSDSGCDDDPSKPGKQQGGGGKGATREAPAAVRIMPIEQDELALKFLRDHDGNIDQAMFSIVCDFGAGVDTSARRWLKYYNKKAQAGAQATWKTLYSRRDATIFGPRSLMNGDFQGRDGLNYPMPLSRDVLPTASLKGGPQDLQVEDNEASRGPGGSRTDNLPLKRGAGNEEGDAIATAGRADSPGGQGQEEDSSQQQQQQPPRKKKRQTHRNSDLRALLSDVANHMDMDGISSGRSRGTDRSSMKARWTSLLSDAERLVGDIEGATVAGEDGEADTRPHFVELLELFADAYDIPVPEQSPGEDFVDCLHKTFLTLLSYVGETRNYISLVHDALSTNEDGISLPPIRRLLEKAHKVPVILEETAFLEDLVSRVTSWETKLERLMNSGNGKPTLSTVRELLLVSNKFPVRLKIVMKLEEKVAKALAISSQVQAWSSRTEEEKKSFSLRSAQALLREAHRTNLSFPEMKVLSDEVERCETWHEKTVRAVRAKVPLKEILDLLLTSERLNINFEEQAKKLKMKADACELWVRDLRAAVPVSDEVFEDDYVSLLAELRSICEKDGKDKENLENLLSEGCKLPAMVDHYLLLQAELSSCEWTAKAGEVLDDLPSPYKLKKLLKDSKNIRESLPLPPRPQKSWELKLEDEVFGLSQSCDEWLTLYKDFNPHHNLINRKQASIQKVKEILDMGRAIKADLSNECESLQTTLNTNLEWLVANYTLLKKCGIEVTVPVTDLEAYVKSSKKATNNSVSTLDSEALLPSDAGADADADSGGNVNANANGLVTDRPSNIKLSDLLNALSAPLLRSCKVEIAEMTALKEIVFKAKRWIGRAKVVFPKVKSLDELHDIAATAPREYAPSDNSLGRGKRSSSVSSGVSAPPPPVDDDEPEEEKATKPAYSEMQSLIDEGKTSPINFGCALKEFKEVVEQVKVWQAKSMGLLEKISSFSPLLWAEDQTIENAQMSDADGDSAIDTMQDLHAKLMNLLKSAKDIDVDTREERLAAIFLRIYYFCKSFKTRELDGNDANLLTRKGTKLYDNIQVADGILTDGNAEKEEVAVNMSASWLEKVSDYRQQLKTFAKRKEEYERFALSVTDFFNAERRSLDSLKKVRLRRPARRLLKKEESRIIINCCESRAYHCVCPT